MKMGDKDGNVNNSIYLSTMCRVFIDYIIFHIFEKASECDQEIRQSHTAAPRGRDAEH